MMLARRYYLNRLGLRNKAGRVLWGVLYVVLFRPFRWPLFRRWRNLLLRACGARIGRCSTVHATARIWAPWNLEMGEFTSIAPTAIIYNVDKIILGAKVVISQEAYLCTASHDIESPGMELVHRAIVVGDGGWVTTRAFVGPGVTVGEGAVVGACAVVTKDVEPWTVVVGNPARVLKKRTITG